MKSFHPSNRKSTQTQTQDSEARVDSEAFAGVDATDPYVGEGQKREILTYEQRYNSRGELQQLEIQSPYIKAALREVVKSYPGVNINSNGPISIWKEPWYLFHYRHELSTYASKLRDKKARGHVVFLLEYAAKVLHRDIANYEAMMHGEAAPGLEFPALWMAFKPGTLIFTIIEGHDSIFRLNSISREHETIGGGELLKEWNVSAEHLISNGAELGYVRKDFRIPRYEGYKALTELKTFPLQYHPDCERVKRDLLARGKKYVSLQGIHHSMYEGPTHTSGFPSLTSRSKEYSTVSSADDLASEIAFNNFIQKTEQRVMLDIKTYNDRIRTKKLTFISGAKTHYLDPEQALELSDEELLICEHFVHGFSFAHKDWRHFEVSKLKPVEYNQSAFDTLGHEEYAIFTFARKGKGLIILLHGPPGVGKTFTAESIADFSERPLYKLGGSDFGDSPFLVSDQALRTALNLALRWKAVVLMDEADVFLQQRDIHSSLGNKSASVLLRLLEYFDGTMFLTTNRVQTIDAAFKSRIHLSLSYPPLPAQARSMLWETFILKGTEQRRPRWLTEKFLGKISKEEVNGREIKNIIRVAHAFAVDGKRAMRPADVTHGLQTRRDFELDFSKAVAKRKHEDDQTNGRSKKQKKKNMEFDGEASS
ncbi:P-loop containing nucleoside triphosphate hydrolase protein [Mytilinidion resinicola]|uniref:P-loop containing nucleoside triphosphate hydrolase protein n=1 Tax=Mytilinidion resinicola TaxID=574789 RepID=A0A6A6YVQ5_9PEZI|nr:P-loop containing nucleoside triphosphate hydrolase protein [Mytilinidion resinicola]KAF2813036.1 P-loop containing nucleoside triphosphate hydrolase protein [Mytilinidion resinicola]